MSVVAVPSRGSPCLFHEVHVVSSVRRTLATVYFERSEGVEAGMKNSRDRGSKIFDRPLWSE